MGIHFEEIWIINDSGLPLFNKKASNNTKSINFHLFAAFITAFQMMTSSEGAQGLETIKLNKSKLIFRPVFEPAKLMFVTHVSLKAKEDNVYKAMDEIIARFLSDYEDILDTWTFDSSIFEPFAKRVTDYVK